MPVFLFWNVGKKPRPDLIASACNRYGVEVLILAESAAPTSQLLGSLNNITGFVFTEFKVVESRIRFFHRLSLSSIRAIHDDGQVSIRAVRPPLGSEILVVACHLPSKLYSNSQDQYYTARKLRNDIINAENNAGHKNSFVVGDFNMNPFEEAMNAADGLNAVMDKRVACARSRSVKGEACDFFYNPMWSRLGDESDGPAGTYYRAPSHISDFFWHTFDQVLLRPTLLPFYKKDNLKVLTEINGVNLVTNDRPDKSISDHLPILLVLNTEWSIEK